MQDRRKKTRHRNKHIAVRISTAKLSRQRVKVLKLSREFWNPALPQVRKRDKPVRL